MGISLVIFGFTNFESKYFGKKLGFGNFSGVKLGHRLHLNNVQNLVYTHFAHFLWVSGVKLLILLMYSCASLHQKTFLYGFCF